MMVRQREIVEVPFVFPDGSILPHTALVVSNNDLQDDEGGLFYAVLISTKNHHPQYTIPIKNEWLNKPLGRQSFFVTHILNMFTTDMVMKSSNTFIRPEHLD